MLGISKATTAQSIDITNPEDWSQNCPEMKGIDSLLQCPICYDFMHTSMMIMSCSHTFCSLCIRQHLSYQNKCPACNVPSVESDLRNNRLIDEVIQQFKSVRSKILKSGAEVNHSPFICKQASTAISTRLRTKTNGVDEFSRTKNMISRNITDMMSPIRKSSKLISFNSKSNCRTPVTNTQENPIMSSPMIDLVSDESDLDDSLSASLSLSDKENRSSVDSITDSEVGVSNNNVHTKDVHSVSSVFTMERLVDDKFTSVTNDSHESCSSPANLVSCPVCGVMLKEQVINLHLDTCLTGAERKAALRKATPKRKPMAKLVYSLMSDKDIRKKLKDIGLSTVGNRKLLIKRHHDFILMYNAECDSLKPKSAQEIVKELEKNEKLKNKKLSPVKRLQIDKNSSPATIERAQKSYVKTHKNHFAGLIEETRLRMKKQKEERNKQKQETCCKSIDTESEEKPEEWGSAQFEEETENLEKNVPPFVNITSSETADLCLNDDNVISKNKHLGKNCEIKFLGPELDNKLQKQTSDEISCQSAEMDIAQSSNVPQSPEVEIVDMSKVSQTLEADIVSTETTPQSVDYAMAVESSSHQNQKSAEICDTDVNTEEKEVISNHGDSVISDCDSDSETDEDILQEINKSIETFDSEECEDIIRDCDDIIEDGEDITGSSLGTEYENIWPALSQLVPATVVEKPPTSERMRHRSGVSDVASDVSGCSELSAILPPVSANEKMELEVIRSLRSRNLRITESEKDRNLRKRKREQSVETPVTRSKRRR